MTRVVSAVDEWVAWDPSYGQSSVPGRKQRRKVIVFFEKFEFWIVWSEVSVFLEFT